MQVNPERNPDKKSQQAGPPERREIATLNGMIVLGILRLTAPHSNQRDYGSSASQDDRVNKSACETLLEKKCLE